MKHLLKCVILILFYMQLTGNLFAVKWIDSGFLKISGNAKIGGLGGYTVCNEVLNVSATDNPALLCAVEDNDFGLTHNEYPYGIRNEYMSLAKGLEFGTVGLGLSYTTTGEIEGRNEYGDRTSDFSGSDAVIMLSYAKAFGMTKTGVNVYPIIREVDGNFTWGLGSDLGVIHRLAEIRALSLGVVVQHLGFQKEYLSGIFMFPLLARIGLNYRMFENINLCASISLSADFISSSNVGIEYEIIRNVFLRAGYRLKTFYAGYYESGTGKSVFSVSTNIKELDFTGGIGFRLSNYIVDYSVENINGFGLRHVVSIGFKTGKIDY